jgi:hypothetical protein
VRLKASNTAAVAATCGQGLEKWLLNLVELTQPRQFERVNCREELVLRPPVVPIGCLKSAMADRPHHLEDVDAVFQEWTDKPPAKVVRLDPGDHVSGSTSLRQDFTELMVRKVLFVNSAASNTAVENVVARPNARPNDLSDRLFRRPRAYGNQ